MSYDYSLIDGTAAQMAGIRANAEANAAIRSAAANNTAYAQGHTEGWNAAIEEMTKILAEKQRELDIANANRKGFLVEREITKNTLIKLKGQDWYNEWFKQTKAAKDRTYDQFLIDKGYKIKGINA